MLERAAAGSLAEGLFAVAVRGVDGSFKQPRGCTLFSSSLCCLGTVILTLPARPCQGAACLPADWEVGAQLNEAGWVEAQGLTSSGWATVLSTCQGLLERQMVMADF